MTVKLKDICSKIGSGATPRGGKETYCDNGISLVRSQNVLDFEFTDSGLAHINDEQASKLSNVEVIDGDVLINITGDSVARVCKMDAAFLPARVNQHVAIVRGEKDKVLSSYILYYLQMMKGHLLQLASAGATRNALTKGMLEQLELELPDIETQMRITSVLDSFQEKIALNRKINDNLYEMVSTYYSSLFKDTKREMTTIGNYAERIYSGGTPSTSNTAYWNGAFGWFSSGETRNRFVITTEKTITQAGVDNSSTKLAAKHDIVMASAGQGFTRGQTSMLLMDTYVNQSVIVIHSERNILPYLFWNLANRYEELRAISDSSSIRGSLTTKMIAGLEIPLAEEESIQAFADFAWSVIPQIENNLLENERLAALRDSILPKLMSGELDVSGIQL